MWVHILIHGEWWESIWGVYFFFYFCLRYQLFGS
jgi:hypothetical protein